MLVGGVMAITSYCWKHRLLSLVFGSVAVLFNPLLAIHLPKQTWELIDMLVFWVFFIGPGYLWPKSGESPSV
ncbi:MAG: hypothetical protein RL514_3573 [Verrucomicrobiota bacterium]